MTWGVAIGGAISIGSSMLNRRSAQQGAAADSQAAREAYERQLADMRANQSNPYGSVEWGKDKWGNPVRQVSMNQQDADRLQELRSVNAQRMANAGRVRLADPNSLDYSAFTRGGTGNSRPVGQAIARLEADAAPPAAYSQQRAPRTVWDGEPALAGGQVGGAVNGSVPVQGGGESEDPMLKAMNRRAALGGGYLR